MFSFLNESFVRTTEGGRCNVRTRTTKKEMREMRSFALKAKKRVRRKMKKKIYNTNSACARDCVVHGLCEEVKN